MTAGLGKGKIYIGVNLVKGDRLFCMLIKMIDILYCFSDDVLSLDYRGTAIEEEGLKSLAKPLQHPICLKI